MPYLNDEHRVGQPRPPWPSQTTQAGPFPMTVNGVTNAQAEAAKQAAAQRAAAPQQISAGDTPLAAAHAMMVDAHAQHRAWLDAVGRDAPRYSQDGLAQELHRFAESPAARSIDTAEQVFADREAAAQAEVAHIRRGMVTDGDSAAQTRAQRLWQRSKPLLDGQNPGKQVAIAQQMIRDADPVDRGTFLEELPAHFQAQGLPTSWIEDTAAEADPQLAQACQRLTSAQQARTIARHNAALLRKGIQNNCAPTALVDPRDFDPDR